MPNRNLLPLVLLAVTLPAQSLDPPPAPRREGYRSGRRQSRQLKFHFVAAGKQIYQCENGAWRRLRLPMPLSTTWTRIQAASRCRAIMDNNRWQKHRQSDRRNCNSLPSADGTSIDWLKLDVDKSSRTGEFSAIGIIQRLYTGAGKAPLQAAWRTRYTNPLTPPTIISGSRNNLPDSPHRHTVRRNRNSMLGTRKLFILMRPKIPGAGRRRHLQIRPSDCHSGRFGAAVEHGDGPVAAFLTHEPRPLAHPIVTNVFPACPPCPDLSQ